MSKKLNKSELRTRHLENLSSILGYSYEKTKVIFKDLKAIESNGRRAAEQYCNGDIDSDGWNKALEPIKGKLRELLPESLLKNIHLNGDCRGYFLKIDDGYTRELFKQDKRIETDWGHYGIICPEGI